MDFSVESFARELFELLLESNQFPFMRDEALDKAKHSKRNPLHLRDAIRQNTIIISGGENVRVFEIGNEMLEHTHPYYHILEDAPVIRKRGKGTAKSKGSQAKIEDVGKRDYARVEWNGKTFTKEYDRNVRGSRKPKNVMIYGNGFIMNRDASAYQNIHYKYIENILNGGVLDRLAMTYGLKRQRTVNGGLGEEYEMQRMIDMFGSYDIV